MGFIRNLLVLGWLGLLLAAPAGCDGKSDDAPPVETSGRYSACESDANCDGAHGFSCIESLCRYACDSHFDCADVGLCRSFERGSFCSPEPEPQAEGQFYTSCPDTVECDTASGFYCIGAGVGDLDSYCTRGCAEDSECPTGFFCESSSVTPCDDACNVSGDPSDPECVPSSEIGDGKDYRCTLVGPVRDQCVKRAFCAECETDDDCRATPGLICAKDIGGAKICTPPCDEAVDSCPWGNAAICGVWDEERGVATCAHRFGSCRGEGAPCEPCVRDRDCRETGFCYGSSFTGERYCIDFAEDARCSCVGERTSGGVCTGGGCPETPGQLEMLCYVGADTSAPGLCYGANSSPNPLLGSPQTGCWEPR